MSEGYVLVVDDEPNIAMCLEYLMKRQGYSVKVAPDGETALDTMRERVPDVMLLDVMMPRRDGYDICQTVRATPAWKDVRIIMLSGRGRAIEREKGLALGADDYITKPFSTDKVIERVRQYMPEHAG